MKQQINEGLADRLKSALSILRSRKEESQEPHFADPIAKADSSAPEPEKTEERPELSAAELRHGDMLRASTNHTVYTRHLAAGRDFHEMLTRHAADLAALQEKHGNSLSPLEAHVTKLSRAHLAASREAHRVTENAKEEAALAGITALRGAGFTVLQSLKDNKTKPMKPVARQKYPSVTQVPKETKVDTLHGDDDSD